MAIRLSNHKRDPLATRAVVFDRPAAVRDDVPNPASLFDQNPGEDNLAARLQGALDFSKQLGNDVRREVAQQQIHGFGSHGVDRSTEYRDEVIRVALDILGGDAYRVRIVVAPDHMRCNPGAGRQWRECRSPFQDPQSIPNGSLPGPVFETFQSQLRGLVGSGSERLARINSNGHAIRWTRRFGPAGNDVETVAYRKADVRLLPFTEPVAIRNCPDDDPRQVKGRPEER